MMVTSGSFLDLLQKSKSYKQMINVDEMAQSVNLSVSNFTSLFKKNTGFSPIEYYNHLKIQKACQYLIFTDLRVKEISYKIGINDPYYFSKLFTKVMGASPIEYREKKGSLILTFKISQVFHNAVMITISNSF